MHEAVAALPREFWRFRLGMVGADNFGMRFTCLASVSALSLLGTYGATGCSADSGGGAASGGAAGGSAEVVTATSNLARELNPAVSDEARLTLATDNQSFAWALYGELAKEGGNLFLSPYSISSALAMTYAGAEGQTEADMAATLRFTLPEGQLHPAFNRLDLDLESRAKESSPALPDGTPFQLSVANALWGQRGLNFRQGFLDTLAVNYGAGMNVVDFAGATEEARQQINAWVSDKTEERIPELLEKKVLTQLTRLVLTNAIYFKANWAQQFSAAATSTEAFTRLTGDAVDVSFMHQTDRFAYAFGDGWQMVRLPYGNGNVVMDVVLPESGRFPEVEARLREGALNQTLAAASSVSVRLSLPKWEFDSAFSLKDQLTALGMGSAFDPALADFSGMTEDTRLSISEVIHKAFIAVDEEGTEAAAATAVVLWESGAAPTEPDVPVDFTADRPFLFMIRDIPTGALLFVGRVVDPS